MYSKADDIPLPIQSKAMTELFDYVVELHTVYMRESTGNKLNTRLFRYLLQIICICQLYFVLLQGLNNKN